MINGVLNIYKEAGFTSHDVVAKLRGILKIKKIGHTGTLDPEATGVLPVCIGKATKLCDMLTDTDKAYFVVMKLGIKTDTLDTTGTIIKTAESKALEKLTKERIEKTVLSFVGDIMQIPPMYSALKVNGKKLYELAREGKEVERKPRPVKIYEINDLKINENDNTVSFLVKCSKGTYIRTLCDDIGEKLGCFAAMEKLERTRAAGFDASTSKTLSEIEDIFKNGGEEKIKEILVPIDKMFSLYPAFTAKKEAKKALCNGNLILKSDLEINENFQMEDNDKCRIYDSEGTFVGVYTFSEETFKVDKMFYEN